MTKIKATGRAPEKVPAQAVERMVRARTLELKAQVKDLEHQVQRLQTDLDLARHVCRQLEHWINELIPWMVDDLVPRVHHYASRLRALVHEDGYDALEERRTARHPFAPGVMAPLALPPVLDGSPPGAYADLPQAQGETGPDDAGG